MPIIAAAAAPALPELSVADPGAHVAQVEALLSALPPFEVALLLAGGDEPMVHDAPCASMRPTGAPRQERAVRIDEAMLRAVVRRGQVPRTQSASLTGALGSLAVRLVDVAPDATIVPITIAAGAQPVALDAAATGLSGAVTASGREVVVLAAGDLADAGASDDERARRWDDRAAAAVAAGDLAELRSLGPAAAQEVGALGWAPLTVLLRMAERERLRVTRSTYQLTGAVGRLATLLEPVR